MTATAPPFRLKVDHARIDANFRPATYTIVNALFNQQRLIGEALHLGPEEAAVYTAVSLASVQKLVRRAQLPDSFRGLDPLPANMVGMISRRAVAAATGIPRETVRRIIAAMIARGQLIGVGRNAVRVARDNARRENLTDLPHAMMGEILHMIEELLRLEVLVEY